MSRLWVAAVSVIAFLASASVALAQDPTGRVYGGNGGQISGELGGGGSLGSQASSGSGSLPFTGLDLLFFFAAGAVLIAVGLGLRRLARAKS